MDIWCEYSKKMLDNPAIKAVGGGLIWIVRLISGLYRPAYGIVATLLILDAATGYYHAWRNPDIVPTSGKMKAGVYKCAVYMLVLVLAHLLASSGHHATLLLQSTLEVIIMVTEFTSIVENVDKICILHGVDIPIIKTIVKILTGKRKELGG